MTGTVCVPALSWLVVAVLAPGSTGAEHLQPVGSRGRRCADSSTKSEHSSLGGGGHSLQQCGVACGKQGWSCKYITYYHATGYCHMFNTCAQQQPAHDAGQVYAPELQTSGSVEPYPDPVIQALPEEPRIGLRALEPTELQEWLHGWQAEPSVRVPSDAFAEDHGIEELAAWPLLENRIVEKSWQWKLALMMLPLLVWMMRKVQGEPPAARTTCKVPPVIDACFCATELKVPAETPSADDSSVVTSCGTSVDVDSASLAALCVPELHVPAGYDAAVVIQTEGAVAETDSGSPCIAHNNSAMANVVVGSESVEPSIDQSIAGEGLADGQGPNLESSDASASDESGELSVLLRQTSFSRSSPDVIFVDSVDVTNKNLVLQISSLSQEAFGDESLQLGKTMQLAALVLHGEVVCYASYSVRRQLLALSVHKLAVAKSHQRRGLGRIMIRHLTQVAKRRPRGQAALEVVCLSALHTAVDFYRSCGFYESAVASRSGAEADDIIDGQLYMEYRLPRKKNK